MSTPTAPSGLGGFRLVRMYSFSCYFSSMQRSWASSFILRWRNHCVNLQLLNRPSSSILSRIPILRSIYSIKIPLLQVVPTQRSLLTCSIEEPAIREDSEISGQDYCNNPSELGWHWCSYAVPTRAKTFPGAWSFFAPEHSNGFWYQDLGGSHGIVWKRVSEEWRHTP